MTTLPASPSPSRPPRSIFVCGVSITVTPSTAKLVLPESTCWTGPSSVTSRAFSGFSGLILSFEATSVASPRNVPFAETRRPGRIAENETRS